MKTSELIGPALDWAVAKCEGNEITIRKGCLWIPTDCYSADCSQAGPIIEREKISVFTLGKGWGAQLKSHRDIRRGPTPLIAAMRAYVASKLGNEVEVPEELT
jgi:hypothetical protein